MTRAEQIAAMILAESMLSDASIPNKEAKNWFDREIKPHLGKGKDNG